MRAIWLISAILILFVVSGTVLAGAPICAMFMHDCRHSCQSNFNGPGRPNIQWFTDMGAIAAGPVAVAEDGTVYVVFSNYSNWRSTAYSITQDGGVKWELEIGPIVVRNTPAIGDDGTVYLLTATGLFALSPDGQLKWKQPAVRDDWSSPIIGPDGTVYAVNGWRVCAVNPDGSIRWRSHPEEMLCLPPAVAPNGNIYAIAWLRSTDQAKLIALDPEGRQIWDYYVAGWNVSTLCVAEDSSVRFYSFGQSSLLNLNADGQLLWSFETEPPGPFGSPEVLLGIGADGTTYLMVGKPEEEPNKPIYQSTLFALGETGEVIWSRNIDGLPPLGGTGLAIGADGTLFVGTEQEDYSEMLYALGRQGNEKWRFRGDGATSPVVGDGRIYLSYWGVTSVADYGSAHINLLLDQSWFYPGGRLSLTVAGENMGPSTDVDFYLVMWDSEGRFYSWPSWQPGVSPGLTDVHIPYGMRWRLQRFAEMTLPCDEPPINRQGRFWFAVALTKTQTMEFLCSPDIQHINFVADWQYPSKVSTAFAR